MKIKLTYIVSHIDKALAFEWIVQNLDKQKFDLSFILLNPGESDIEIFLNSHNIKVLRVPYHDKWNAFRSLWCIWFFLKRNRIQIVHAHLFDACLIGLTAAKLAGVKRRIYTRHNSTIHHRYHPNAVKYDKIINYLSTKIFAISEVTQRVLVELEGVNPDKIKLIHHGFKFNSIPPKDSQRVDQIRQKYELKNAQPVIGVVSRYIQWKGIQYIIPAFRQILNKYPKAKLVLANAGGPFNDEVKENLQKLDTNSFIEIKFEKDIFALFKTFDVFIHTPIDPNIEAFGQVYIEALACEVPSIFTSSGIASEIIEEQHNALLVRFESIEDIEQAIEKILSDDVLKQKLINNGKKDVISKFGIQRMMDKLEEAYIE